MPDVVLDPITLTNFISQIHHVMQTTACEANGTVADQARERHSWDEIVNRFYGVPGSRRAFLTAQLLLLRDTSSSSP